jgi:hypothetical protein
MHDEPMAAGPEEIASIDASASAVMKRGLRLMDAGDPTSLMAALRCFNDAYGLRRQLPVDTQPLLRYGLAASCLNRSDVLVRLGGETNMADALASYDEAIDLLRGLPLSDDPRFPRRLAMAHHNRALALQARDGTTAEVIAAFSEALAVLEHEAAAMIPDLAYLRAVVWMNFANARLSEGSGEARALARTAALTAIAHVAAREFSDADAAEAGLKARHVLCRSVAERLAPAATRGAMSDEVHEATDVADEGLSLVRAWEQKGVGRFRPIACDLFRFGARVYAMYQPHFLDEFIHENSDAARSSPGYVNSAEMRAALEEARRLVHALNRHLPRK